MKKFLLSVICLLCVAEISAQTNFVSNPGFENWDGAVAEDWSGPAGHNATVSQSTDAHSGNYSIAVAGNAKSNKRLASKSYTLAAGTYTFSVYVKANGTETGFCRLGYVPVVDGNVGTYTYESAAASATTAEWAERVYEFTLAEETTIALIVMNNKNGSGASFLVDDVTLTNGKATEGGEGEGETEVTATTIAEVIAAGAGEATTKGTVVATYSRGFLMNDGTGSILVYQGSDKGFAAGDAVTVSGTTSVYSGLLQFGNTAVVEKTGTATVTHPAATVIDGAAMDAYLAAPSVQYVEYTGTLTVNGNHYNVAVEGAATAVGSIQYPQDAIKANLTNGTVIKVTGYTIGVSSSKYLNTMAVKVETVSAETPEAKEYINETFASDFGVFSTAETVGEAPWIIDYETAKATSYIDGTNNPATSWLISSPVDFTEETEAYVAFEYIIRYSESGKVADNHQLLISADYAGDPAAATWTDLPYGAVEGSDWTTFYQANVAVPAEFLGKNGITFALRYTATTKAGTWEVRNFVVAHGAVAEPEEPETPETKEYTVTEALAAYVDGQQIPAIVTGYIVGAMNSSGYVPEFGTTTVATNLLLSDNADEQDIANCIIVQLPSGEIRSALNLVDNPDNYKKQVKITGSIEKYFQVAGLKTPTAYEFTGTTGIENVKGENGNVKTIFDLTGRRVKNITAPGIYIVGGKKVLVK